MSSNRWKSYLLIGSAGLASAAAAIAYITQRALHEALPRVEGSTTLAGLRRPVEIIRDRWGVPHIYAATEHDLFFAQGYVQAQDRLFQMDAQRRVGYGRLSEIAGPLGLASDRLARASGWPLAAEAQWQGIQKDPQTKAMACAFADGVNAFIARDALPAEYRVLLCSPEPWHPRDGAAWGAVLAWGLSVNWQTELLRLRLVEALGVERAADLAPVCDDGESTILQQAAARAPLSKALIEALQQAARLPLGQLAAGSGLGSNNWVVSGAWSASGRPVLANDPHLPPIFPTLWYENHLVGGAYNVSGFTSPGVPGVIIGHNEHIAWGVTSGYADVQDLFVEQFHETDRLLYRGPDGWRRAAESRELIHVRGRRKPVRLTVRHTHHGPVISDVLTNQLTAAGAHGLALRWASHDENNHLAALLGICRARNWQEMRQAARDWAFPPQNVVYADVAGNIGYLLPGKIPIRQQGSGLAPAAGWQTESEWQGWIAPDELPALYNPPSGYIVTANNQVAGPGYPYLLTGEWLPPYRAQRITELLHELAPLDIAAHGRIQNDKRSLPLHQFVQQALQRINEPQRQALSPAAARALRLLASWDGQMDAAAVAPSIAFGWAVRFTRAAMSQALGTQLARELLDENALAEIPGQPFHVIAQELARRWLQHGAPQWVGHVQPLLPAALEDAVALLQARLGPRQEAWQWGRLHYVKLHSYLAHIPGLGRLWKPQTHAIGGDGFTVSQADVVPRFPPEAVHVIASCRFIVDVGQWDNSVSALPGGQSGHPASEHYQDSVAEWLQGSYHPMLFSRERVEEAASNRLSLLPAEEKA